MATVMFDNARVAGNALYLSNESGESPYVYIRFDDISAVVEHPKQATDIILRNGKVFTAVPDDRLTDEETEAVREELREPLWNLLTGTGPAE